MGINQWHALMGEAPASQGNRTEIHVSEMTLIQGPYKLLTGGLEILENMNKHKADGSSAGLFPVPVVPFDGVWDGYGIAADVHTLTKMHWCFHGCLYNIEEDPTETVDLA